MAIVALLNYARESKSRPTPNIWWAHTIQPIKPIQSMAICIGLGVFKLSIILRIKHAKVTSPKAGAIRTYTSGCPKNQNKCWNKITLPPPLFSKKNLLKFRSQISIVIPTARTGNLRINKKTVTTRQRLKIWNFIKSTPTTFFPAVHIKLFPLEIDLPPFIWREYYTRSALLPGCPSVLNWG